MSKASICLILEFFVCMCVGGGVGGGCYLFFSVQSIAVSLKLYFCAVD